MTRSHPVRAHVRRSPSKVVSPKFLETTERLRREREVNFIKQRIRVPAVCRALQGGV